MQGMNESPMESRKAQARAWFENLQDQIIAAFEALEDECLGPFNDEAPIMPGRFERKPWARENHDGAPGGGGRMGLLHGRFFEKAGVHTSTVFGTFAPEFAKQIPGADEDPRFWASGISLIAHPWNPNAPTVHMNTRFVVTSKAWFGGGGDLTPVLMKRRTQDDRDTRDFHAAFEAACGRHADVADYAKYKAWCDEYFYLKHRQEPRGIGGIFFDDLNAPDFATCFSLQQSVGNHFLDAYVPILERRKELPYGERERDWQAYRRGRYVEFNLVWDRGTLFGLQSGGRTESILMSLPPIVKWRYDWQPARGSAEAALASDFLIRKNWLT